MFPLPWNFPFRKKDGTITNIDDAMSGGGGEPYTLPTASASVKGGIKIGAGLAMEGEVLNNTNPTAYNLPTASAETLGGVKVGSGLSISEGGILSANGGGGGTQIYYKDFDLSFSDWMQIATESPFYCGSSNTNINITGFTPISCDIWDKNTGYRAMGGISRWHSTGNDYKIIVQASKSSSSGAFSARIFYIKDTDLTPIPTE